MTLAVALVVPGIWAVSARAAGGLYTQMLCSDSDSGLGVASNGVLPPGLSFSYRDNESYALAPGTTMCGPGNVGSFGGIHVDSGHAYASGYPLTGVAALTYTPAPDTSLVRFTIFMPIWLGPPEYREGVTVHGGDPLDILAGPRIADCEWRGNCTSFGTVFDPFSAANVIQWFSPPPDGFSITMGCLAPETSAPCYANDQFFQLYGGQMTLHDEANPTPSSPPTGGLLTDDPVKGTEDFTVNGTDRGAGLYRVITLIDGATTSAKLIDTNGGQCVDVNPVNADAYEFASTRPCKPSAGGTFTVDTHAVADGKHNFKVQLEDASGNATTVVDRTVTVQNTPPPAPVQVLPPTSTQSNAPAVPAPSSVGSPPVQPGAPQINGINGGNSVLLSITRRRVVHLHHGQSATLRGRLTTPTGDPVSGAKIDVLQGRTASSLVGKLQVTTGRDGRFRYVVAAGVSRVIRLGYRATIGDGSFAHFLDVRVRVRAALTFQLNRHSLRNGQTLIYSGTLLGPSNVGRFVVVEVHNGSKWQVICSLRTTRRGTFICGHRFTRTFVSASYAFRAVVPPQAGMPYDPAHSRTQRVRVRP